MIVNHEAKNHQCDRLLSCDNDESLFLSHFGETRGRLEAITGGLPPAVPTDVV